MTWIRSLSFTRNSCKPFIRVTPCAKAAATASTGYSSIIEGARAAGGGGVGRLVATRREEGEAEGVALDPIVKLGDLRRRGLRLRRSGCAAADAGEGRTHRDGLVLLNQDLLQRAGHRGRDLGVDLVGGDLEERLIDLDRVADLLEPPGDGALGDALAELGHRDGGRHLSSFAVVRVLRLLAYA